MDVSIILSKDLYEAIFKETSTYNLGVAVTTLSIFITLVGLTLQKKFQLRVYLRSKKIYFYLAIAGLSFTILLFQEFSILPNAVIFGAVSALLMLVSVVGFAFAIYSPIKSIKKSDVYKLHKILNKFLVYQSKIDFLDSLDDLSLFYDSLLELSLDDKEARQIFYRIFSSKHFLKLFTEHGFLFERTIEFYIESPKPKNQHILNFVRKLFRFSLENKDSYLNSFAREDIYPNDLSYLDSLFIERTDLDFSHIFFYEIDYQLSIEAKLAFISLVHRYFKIAQWENNHVSFGKDGYRLKVRYNDEFIYSSLKLIKKYFENTHEKDDFKKLWKEVESFGWYYQWANKTKDKSVRLRRFVGEFVYDVFEEAIRTLKFENEWELRFTLNNFADHFLDTQENTPENNISQRVFVQKMKAKILTDEFGSNIRGYYPQMLKVYFLLFGFEVFSSKNHVYLRMTIHIPILRGLRTSFKKIYMGQKQEYYERLPIPEAKRSQLEEEGRQIILDFLPENMKYDHDSNSLTYYYSKGITGSRISLEQFSDDVTAITVESI